MPVRGFIISILREMFILNQKLNPEPPLFQATNQIKLLK